MFLLLWASVSNTGVHTNLKGEGEIAVSRVWLCMREMGKNQRREICTGMTFEGSRIRRSVLGQSCSTETQQYNKGKPVRNKEEVEGSEERTYSNQKPYKRQEKSLDEKSKANKKDEHRGIN